MATCLHCGNESEVAFQYCPQCGTKAGAEGGPKSLVGLILNGKYRIVETIGSGATGTVYLGEHVGLKKRVALKVLHSDLDLGQEALQRFQQEGIAAGKFSHPHAIDITDFDQAQGDIVYLAMEYVEGQNLREYLEERGKLPLDEAYRLTGQILGALAAAHRHEIVHRDLKPDNVMVSPGADGRPSVKVLDFGLSKLLDRKLDASLQTQVGRIMGTPLYMAPEQCAGQDVDLRSDLYSVGLLLYEMVAGMRPFAEHGTTELLLVRVTSEAPSLLADHPGLAVPEELDEFLTRALSRSRDDRFQSAAEMLRALEELPVTASGTPKKRKPRPKARSSATDRRTYLPYAALVLVAVVVGYVALTVLQDSQSRSLVDEIRTREYEIKLSTAKTLFTAGQLSQALTSVDSLLQEGDGSVEALLLRAAIYRAKDDDDTARKDLEEALTLDPDSVEAHLALGWLAYDRGDAEAAEGSFETARRLAPEAAGPLTALGKLARERGDGERAGELLAQAVAAAPRDAATQVELGKLLLRAGDFEAAREAFVQAKRADSGVWESYAGLAEAAAAQGDVEDAITQYREAMERAAGEPGLPFDLASLLLAAGRPEEALDVLDDAVGRFPREGRLHAIRGLALESQGRDAEAADALRLAVRNGVDDVDLQTLLAALLHEAGRTDEAVEAFEEVRRLGGEVPLANRHLGLLYFEDDRFADAAARFESVLDFDPEDQVALYNLGVLYMDYLGNAERAAELFERYVAAGGPNARVNDWLRKLRGR